MCNTCNDLTEQIELFVLDGNTCNDLILVTI